MAKIAKAAGLVLVFTLFIVMLASVRLKAYEKGKLDGQLEACSVLVSIAPLLRLISRGCSVDSGRVYIDLNDKSRIGLDEFYE